MTTDYAVTKGAFKDTGLFISDFMVKMRKAVSESRTGRSCTAFFPEQTHKSDTGKGQEISMFCTKPVIMLISASFPVWLPVSFFSAQRQAPASAM